MLPTVAAAAWQGPKLNIDGDNVPVGDVLIWIENQSDYTFAYNKSTFDAARPVTVHMVGADIREILDIVFKDSGLAYSIHDKHVILFPKEEVFGNAKQPAAVAAASATASVSAYPVRSNPQPRSGQQADVSAQPANRNAVTVSAMENRAAISAAEIQEPDVQEPVAAVPATVPATPETVSASATQFVPANAAATGLRLANVPVSPRWAVKTNLLLDATTTMNLAVELRVSPKHTIELSGSYNPFSWPDNRKWKSIAVQPEFRYWVFDPFAGHFIGVHMHWAHYNFGNLPFGSLKNNRYQGDLYGAGFSYGYSWYLGKRWALEATVGVGYAYMEYQRFDPEVCGTCFGWESKHYIGITKLGLNLSFLIK